MTEGSATKRTRVSVVIPVLNAENHLNGLLDALRAQKPYAPDEIILVDSNSSDNTRNTAAAYEGVQLIPVEQFSHGRARNLGVAKASCDIVVFLTQDARPADETWLSNLLQPFDNPTVAASYSRHIPHPDASLIQRYYVTEHFPDGSVRIFSKKVDESLTFERVLFSNVSSAVRREALLSHPFDESLIMSEDRQLARDLMNAGRGIAYTPKSVVIHSHEYSLKSLFRGYFDSAYSITCLFPGRSMLTTLQRGSRYLCREFLFVARHAPHALPNYVFYVFVKGLGVVAGHCAKNLPTWAARRCSLQSYYWDAARQRS